MCDRPPVYLFLLAAALALYGCRTKDARVPSEPTAKTRVDAALGPDLRAPEPVSPQQAVQAPHSDDRPHEVCADCHPETVEAYLKTGMGRSFYTPRDAPVIELFAPEKATVKHPHMSATYRAFIDANGRWWQEETIAGTEYSRTVEVRYIIGSGNHSRSYLGLVNGELTQLPLTWYSQKRVWDMSPGYEGPGHLRFMRPVVPECLFCHNGFSEHVNETSARYAGALAQGIDCARCHGDGSAHVQKRQAGATPEPGKPDPWILNPARLDATRAAEVCQQCHLQGAVRLLHPGQDWSRYSPRTPLREYLTVYGERRPANGFAIASQAERLSESRCRTSDGSSLRCTDCHHPHGKTTVNVRAVCTGCHTPNRCPDVMSRETDTNCTECHMRASGVNDAPHVSFTDHKIQRVALRPARPPTHIQGRPGQMALRPLLKKADAPPVMDALRAAHAEVLHTLVGSGEQVELAHALQRLDKLVPNTQAGPEVLETLGRGLVEIGQFERADRRFQQLNDAHPNRVRYREFHAQALLALGQTKRAAAVLQQAVALQPSFGVAWGLLGIAHKNIGEVTAARSALERAAALMPDDSTVPYTLGMVELQAGAPQRAYTLWQTALRLDPLNTQATVESARYLIANSRTREAVELLHDAERLKPGQAFVQFELGRIAVIQKRMEDAHRHFSLEQRRNPRFEGTYIERAQLGQREDDPDGIRMAIESGRINAPHFPHWEQLHKDLLKATPSAKQKGAP